MTKAATRSDYPRDTALRHELARAAANGLDVAGYTVAPGGLITILTTKAFPAQPRDLFEAEEMEGKL